MMLSAEEFYRLRTSGDPDDYLRAAHDEAPDDVWIEVIERYPDMRFWVAQNKSVPVRLLEILAQDVDWRVRHMVAGKRKLPENVQVRLAHDPAEGVRRALVNNARATPCALELLTHDDVDEIRERATSRLSLLPTKD